MNWLVFSLGAGLLAVTVLDLLWTTLWVEGGAGPLTDRVMAWTWQVLARLGNVDERIQTLTGPLVLTLGLGMWILFLWGGWTLVFASTEAALIDTVDSGPIGLLERVYFVGYTIFTLGNGDFVLRDGPWQAATGLMAGSGMLFITLSITYVLSVLDAVTQKRSFAQNVSGLGQDGPSIVTASWSGDGFTDVELVLNSVTAELNELTANHKAYPILHYFYTVDTNAAAAHSIVALDEAMTLWHVGTAEEARPSEAVLTNARASVRSYLQAVEDSFVSQAEDRPPAPDLAVLRDAGVPTVSDADFDASLDELTTRRRSLYGLVKADAREWPSR